MSRVKYIIVGGFLGAGKTTAALALSHYFLKRNQSVGLLTNDQSADLVDTARAKSKRLPVEEIAGGCLCCEFDTLIERSKSLIRSYSPDVIVAEPVGSCTDLKATVAYPLRKFFGDQFLIAPFSVFVDPNRCAAALGLWGTTAFSKKVNYIYRKQLEEAEIIVIHKADLIDAERRAMLLDAVRMKFRAPRVLLVSSHTGEGTQAWYEAVTVGELGQAPSMEVDYDVYAAGEALLGWFNSRGTLDGAKEFDGNDCLLHLTTRLSDRLTRMGVQIAHLKMSLLPSRGDEFAVVSITHSDEKPVCTQRLESPIQSGELIVNLRAEADPDSLEKAVVEELSAIAQSFTLQRVAAFRPSRPNPKYRMRTVEG